MSEEVVVMFGGSPYVGWLDVDATQSFEDAAGSAVVTLSEQPGDPLPCTLGQPAAVIICGQPVVTGLVYDIDGNHDWGAHTIKVEVADKTVNLIDSQIGPKLKIEAPTTLADAANKTLSTMGLGDISVIDKVGPPPYQRGELVEGAVDDFGFEFLERWARKRQVFLGTDGKGNLQIQRNMGEIAPGYLHKGPEDDPRNNVLRANYKNSLKDRANENNTAGQKSTPDKKYWQSKPKNFDPAQAGPISTNWGTALDSAVPGERKHWRRALRGAEGKTPEETSKWQANINRARGVNYNATVQGFTAPGGGLWWPGKLLPVYDYHFELAQMMFLKQVRWKKTWTGGAQSELTCGPPDSFKPEAESSKAAGRTSSQGLGNSAPGSF